MAMEPIWIVIAVVLAGGVALGQQPTPSAEAAIIRRVSLGKYEAGAPPDQVYHSPDGLQVAYVVRGDRGVRVVLDGVGKGEYDAIQADSLVFSLDSKRVAYIANRGAGSFVVTDGVESRAYESGRILTPPIFSPDGRRTTFVAWRDGKCFVVVDGVEGKPYDNVIRGVAFSSDGSRVAYSAVEGEDSFAVVDGLEERRYRTGRDYGLITPPLFSPDGRRIAYRAFSREGQATYEYVVVDEVEVDRQSAEFGLSGGALAFSPDSRRVAFTSRQGDVWRVIVDAVPGKGYCQVGVPVFSPDSQHVAYAATPDYRRHVVVVDGKEGNAYDGIASDMQWMLGDPGSPMFSPDSAHVAYIGFRRMRTRDMACLVVDGEEGPGYEARAYASWIGRREYALVRGDDPSDHRGWVSDVITRLDRTTVVSPFSPNSRRVGYVAAAPSKWFAVIDGVEEKHYHYVVSGDALFAPDSEHVLYVAAHGKGKWSLVLDGDEGEAHTGDLVTGVVFDSATSFHLLAREDNEFVRLEGEIRPRQPCI